MTRRALIVLAACLAAVSMPAQAQTSASSPATAVKDMLGELWARLRATMPRSAPPAQAATVTAGLRGAEATESELKPYWRGDRDDDPAYRAERDALDRAQGLAETGKYAEALRGFEVFREQYPKSTLTPNAMFGASLARAALGDKARAAAGFEEFLKKEPQHPLARDAELALAALR